MIPSYNLSRDRMTYLQISSIKVSKTRHSILLASHPSQCFYNCFFLFATFFISSSENGTVFAFSLVGIPLLRDLLQVLEVSGSVLQSAFLSSPVTKFPLSFFYLNSSYYLPVFIEIIFDMLQSFQFFLLILPFLFHLASSSFLFVFLSFAVVFSLFVFLSQLLSISL